MVTFSETVTQNIAIQNPKTLKLTSNMVCQWRVFNNKDIL